jgi:hypothetical protein
MTASSDPAPGSGARRVAGGAPPGRVPDFFIVGHHKSGTTALYEMLRRHPQIFMPDLKEPRWFASDLRAPFESPGSKLPRTLEEYMALFAPARPEQLAGEASPSYLRSQLAAAEIAECQPAARCIAILREPASFVRSLHLQLAQEHVEHEQDLRRAVENERLERDVKTVLRYSDHIHYVEQLQRYEAAFPAEQLLVILYDDLRAENEETVRRVLRFLGVDDAVSVQSRESNPTVAVRSVALDSAVRRLYGGRGPLAGLLRRAVPSGARRAVLQTLRRRVVYGRPEPVDEQLTTDLKARYADEVRALARHLDRDVEALWGYDRL